MIVMNLYRNFKYLNVLLNRTSLYIRNGPIYESAVMVSHPTMQRLINCRWIVDCRSKWNETTDSKIDVIRALTCFKYLRLIKAAVREFGPIVEENQKLASLIERANKLNVPQDFIDFVMNISVNIRSNVGLFEILFPSNIHFIVQYEDIDPTTTRHHLIELCERYDATFIQGDIKWPHYFEQKGILSLKCNALPPDKAKEAESLASKVGAEIVQKEIDSEGLEYWKFFCNPWSLHEVRKHLNDIACEVEEACVGYVPKIKISPPGTMKSTVCNVMFELNKIPAIDNVYDNVM